ncbi:hypothetical protein DTO164E3_3005 [Paecilomyces variotii]|nr:hypothetical protein DTO032I3_4604 [Paecilomyces variotii]KAJ9202565.1 hypothetical protein DTO164E3_3005 [Paecilomyces variotii]KAJ9283018.1 hypothetical protein DTO021D3_355 [Paecilomyces variotii]KAJ9343783.1 hypothetical protein DTO027B6_3608 [Paecilomyces variotii]KAJ9387014.1 hypothetical protein DTO032I4_3458 [Paecilomyces variotii]
MSPQLISQSAANGPEIGKIYKDLLTFALNPAVPFDEHKPLYIDAENPTRSLSAGRFRALVRTLIAGLRAHGLQNGDCVLVHMGNHVIYSALFFGIVGAGGVHMGVNPSSQAHELDHFLDLAEPKFIITTPEGLPNVFKATVAKGIVASQICVMDECSMAFLEPFLSSTHHEAAAAENALHVSQAGNKKPSSSSSQCLNISNLLEHGESDWISFDDETTAKATPAAMFTTSGTGGLPKGAILSHYALISQHSIINYDVSYDPVRLMSIPMFHLFGALWAHIFPIRYGQPVYILPRFNLEQYINCISQFQITETYMVPAMVHALNRYSGPNQDGLSSLRYLGIAGAAIDAAAMLRCKAKLHRDANVSQLWGMTEAGVTFQMRYGEQDDTASIGRQLQGTEVKLVDSKGNEVRADGEPGEIYVRGPGLLSCYKQGVPSKDQDGWFRTGDVACVRDGKFYIVGRSKELIKVRGWQVAPAEIEAVLLQHPLIADAAVIGVTLDQAGHNEVPRAFVVPTLGLSKNKLTADEVYKFARSQLSSYKALDGGVSFVAEIPRTPSGKIQRFKLAQMNSYREMLVKLGCASPQL